MKKKTKIVITVIVGIVLIASITLNIVLALKSGIIKEASFLSGYVDESWRKNDADIFINRYDTNRYYSNFNDDYITNIYLRRETNNYSISYDEDFYFFDDLEVYFVVEGSNGERYTTPIKKSNVPSFGGNYIDFDCNLPYVDLRIVEVWVRTID